MQQIIVLIHVLVAISLVALVLLQHGKGADVGAAFGSGSANTMFGSSGSMPFLMKLSAVLAVLFFVTSISLTYIAQRQVRANTISSPATNSVTQTAPTTPDEQSDSMVLKVKIPNKKK